MSDATDAAAALEASAAVDSVDVLAPDPRFGTPTTIVEVTVPTDEGRVPPPVLATAAQHGLGLWPDGCGTQGGAVYVVTFRGGAE